MEQKIIKVHVERRWQDPKKEIQKAWVRKATVMNQFHSSFLIVRELKQICYFFSSHIYTGVGRNSFGKKKILSLDCERGKKRQHGHRCTTNWYHLADLPGRMIKYMNILSWSLNIHFIELLVLKWENISDYYSIERKPRTFKSMNIYHLRAGQYTAKVYRSFKCPTPKG